MVIVVGDANQAFRSKIVEALGREDIVQVSSWEEMDRALASGGGGHGVVIIGPDMLGGRAVEFAERLQSTAPQVSVIFIAHALTSDLLRGALRAGVRDALPASFSTDELRAAVERAEGLAHRASDRSGGVVDLRDASHRIITVSSSKGGVGKSFVTSNLGYTLAEQTGSPVAIVDLDLQFGDMAIMFQLLPERTIYDAAENLARLDVGALKGYLTPYQGKVHVLPAPFEPGLAERVSAEATRTILRMLKEEFRFVLVDTPAQLNDHVLAALDESDECVLVTSLDVPSVKSLRVTLDTIDLLNFGRDRIRLVLNRADSKVGLGLKEVEKTLGAEIDVSIASSREVPRSINRGMPLVAAAPRSPIAKSIGRLAEDVVERSIVRTPAPGADRGART